MSSCLAVASPKWPFLGLKETCVFSSQLCNFQSHIKWEARLMFRKWGGRCGCGIEGWRSNLSLLRVSVEGGDCGSLFPPLSKKQKVTVRINRKLQVRDNVAFNLWKQASIWDTPLIERWTLHMTAVGMKVKIDVTVADFIDLLKQI